MGFERCQKLSDVVELLGKLAGQGLALLGAEIYQMLQGLLYPTLGGLPLVVGQFFHLGLAEHIGQAQQRGHPVGRFGHTHAAGYLADLPVVAVDECGIDGGGIGHSVSFYPNGEIHLAPDEPLGYHLPDFHFLLPIERSDACREI